MSEPPAESGTQALAESLAALAAQLADLRGQVAQVNRRLDRAGLRLTISAQVSGSMASQRSWWVLVSLRTH